MSTESTSAAQVTTQAADVKTTEAPATVQSPAETKPAAAAAQEVKATEVKVEPKTETQKVEETKPETPAVPEKYELKLPEDSRLKPEAVQEIETFAKANRLSNEAAQKVLERENSAIVNFAAAQQTQLKTMNETTWKEQLMADKEVGGSKEKFEESGHLAYRAAETFGGKEFADELKALNLNHSPKLFKTLVRIGRAMADDKMVLTSPNTSSGKDPIEKQWYPKMFEKKE